MPQGIVQNAKAEGLRFHSEYAPTHRSVAAKVITDSLLPYEQLFYLLSLSGIGLPQITFDSPLRGASNLSLVNSFQQWSICPPLASNTVCCTSNTLELFELQFTTWRGPSGLPEEAEATECAPTTVS